MGVTKLQFGGILLSLCFSYTIQAQVFDATKYGARGHIQQGALSAWKEACASTTPSKVLIPSGTYALGEVVFEGPCKASVEFVLQGIVQAPVDPGQLKNGWVKFQYIDKLIVSGGGTFDGRGKLAWTQNTCSQDKDCQQLPINLSFSFVNNSLIKDVITKDSKQFHVNVFGCNNVTFQGFTVLAPGDSPNTDGIHIGRSTGINIIDSNIHTGDDCISLGDGSRQISVSRVNCGPGHGISVGSLGKLPNEAPVVGFIVKNCTLTNTQNGVRIKTWPDRNGGLASDIHFEDIIMQNVSNPILIDQIYCPQNQCNAKVPSQVKISNVSFNNIKGTSATPVAVKLDCSRSVPCENVEIGDIELHYHGTKGRAISACSNVKPNIFGMQIPPACTTSADKLRLHAK